MSRIGKKPIEIPEGVTATLAGEVLNVTGPKGELKREINRNVRIEIKDGKILVLSEKGNLWGLYRALVSNMVEGVSKGFEKKLEIEGVGFKAMADVEGLTLNVGFTNPVKIKKPEGIDFLVEKNVITVSGINKELVGHVASLVRKAKKAEPYKGKGIKYQGEKIRRKEGKKVVAAKK
ncbi:MAG: 50S ribosomal protein L6 [Candidatus Staskawiczbacteria bacterium RIFCSPLOWO2_12_FULL_37_15]|uniref:Large ribosomal subunit protein uL6 n=1 Tax=Candidatus Staskawiczbacteria bacterium RIFCSPLOWO2_12_FULL_37_15 TaxID=1802218 RepID=A0A1G2ISC0_9BACT|nr:MAG: 50S ribosomal protein L6 [Parcubacteria group bacterium GW2011_GWA2_37_10]OGZ77643.1 MAG: 50S ribosomal protein L6 [Candidatus Staskawiczbacteria bacterium RIFCSPLOWO2_12_FULL_37_15]